MALHHDRRERVCVLCNKAREPYTSKYCISCKFIVKQRYEDSRKEAKAKYYKEWSQKRKEKSNV